MRPKNRGRPEGRHPKMYQTYKCVICNYTQTTTLHAHHQCTRWSRGNENHAHCHTCTIVHKLLWEMLLENWKPLNHYESPFQAATCQVKKVKCSLQLKRSQRDSNHQPGSENNIQMDIFSTNSRNSTRVPRRQTHEPKVMLNRVWLHPRSISHQHHFNRWINTSRSVQQMSGTSGLC